MKLKNSLSLRFMLSMAIIIVVMMTINLLWNVNMSQRQAESEMREKATVIAQQLIAARSFIAVQQDTINSDSTGHYEFKHLNPAAVGKGIGDIFNKASGYKFKQTRPQVRDSENKPDNFEVQFMKELAANRQMTEIYGYDVIDGIKVFRYLVPIYFDESCMPCHGSPAGVRDVAGHLKEGYLPGDFSGAISIVFPMTAFEKNMHDTIVTQVLFIICIVLVTIGVIYMLMEHIVIQPIQALTSKVVKIGHGELSAQMNEIHTYDEMQSLAAEFNTMADKLQQLYIGLEEKVAERTRMLIRANLQLAKQGKELMAMNEKLSEADRLKSEFLAVMSHELRTPLTAIIAFTEILLAEGETLSSLQREFLADILDSGHQLLNQINDILDMSKIEAGLVRMNVQVIDLQNIVGEVSRTILPLLTRKQIHYSVHIDENVPYVMADADKIKHILSNLLSNAIKFTPQGKTICVTVSVNKEVEALPAIQIAVDDNGIGISQEDQQYIFDKFRQVDHAKDREYSGSGLGLALARNLVELHGGTISVASAVGQGSKFTFTIPIRAGREY